MFIFENEASILAVLCVLLVGDGEGLQNNGEVAGVLYLCVI